MPEIISGIAADRDVDDLAEENALLELYRSALGMAVE